MHYLRNIEIRIKTKKLGKYHMFALFIRVETDQFHLTTVLLCNPGKSFERAVFKHFYNRLHNNNNILTSLQSCFIPGDSTVNPLTYLYNTFCQALDSGKEVRVVMSARRLIKFGTKVFLAHLSTKCSW